MPEFYRVFDSCNCHKQGNICWLSKNNLNLGSEVDYFCKHRIFKHVLMCIYYKIGAHLEVCILESSQMVIPSHPQLCVCVCVCTRVHTHTHTHTHTAFFCRFFINNAFCLSTPSWFTPLLNLRSPVFGLMPFGWLHSTMLTPYFI